MFPILILQFAENPFYAGIRARALKHAGRGIYAAKPPGMACLSSFLEKGARAAPNIKDSIGLQDVRQIEIIVVTHRSWMPGVIDGG